MTVLIDHADIDPTGEEIEGEFTATIEPQNRGLEFHLQMSGYQFDALEEAVVQAAAARIVGGQNKSAIAKRIEDAAISLLTKKIDAALEPITAEILDRPMIPTVFGKGEPVTLREFVGLCGREYLDQYVDEKGAPAKYDAYSRNETRASRLIRQIIDHKFGEEIKKASYELTTQARAEIKKRQDELIAAERKRIAEALSSAVKI